MAALCKARLLIPFFEQHVLTSRHILVILEILQTVSSLSHCHSDLWSVIFAFTMMTHWRLMWLVFFSSTVFLNYCISFFRLDAVTHRRLQYRVNMACACSRKPKKKKNVWLAYCDICFLWTMPVLCGGSQSRDQTRTTAGPRAAAVTMPEP